MTVDPQPAAARGIAGDVPITLVSPGGHLRRRPVGELHDLWHHGVQDRLTADSSGATWHRAAGKWRAQVRIQGRSHHLGLHETQAEAEAAVAEFRLRNPSTRRRLLPSVRRNHVRCFDARTLHAGRAPVTDVVGSVVTDIVRVTTRAGQQLRCGRARLLLTPDGPRRAGDLATGDEVMIGATAQRPSEALIPPSLRRGIGVWTSMQRTRLIRERDYCYQCEQSFPRVELELDHLVPVALDPRLALDERNLAPICVPCHTRKSAEEQTLARRGGKIAVAKPERLVSAVADGSAPTYCLAVGPPGHNLLAGGIVIELPCLGEAAGPLTHAAFEKHGRVAP